jgi:alkylation response protein AidB-like acyl-CoA dehydrogenase
MDLRDSTEEATFRADLRAWLAANLPVDWADRQPAPGRWDIGLTRQWTKLLYDAGYAGLTWPECFGGRGLPPNFEAIYLEECARADAPEHINVIGLGMVGPTLITHGTPAQQARHLAAILDGSAVFCQGFSEPEAGSDMAAVRTRLDRDGDEFVVNGHKLWSSYAHLADHCLLLGRSDPASSGHAGLTCLLVDLRRPGVEVRPLRQITGDPQFNEILFTDVRVPLTEVVGEIGGGWRIAMTTLSHERSTHAFGLTARLELGFRRLLATARSTGAADAVIRDRIAELWVDLQGLRFTNHRALDRLIRTGAPGPEGSVAKLQWSRLNQRLTTLALQLLGHRAQLDGEHGFWGGYWQYQQLRSRGNTIEGGTSEVLRSIIAERVLGLPRSR